MIWPIRQTRGVNRGYRDQFFRPDDSSVTIQGVGTPVVYRGDRLPKELYGDAFITDSTTNLVHRYKLVDDGSGRVKAVDGYDKGEILASWDERFRPVNMLPAPDGTLYVVDMYRGIVQEQIYWTDFLRDYINARDLVKPVNLGRHLAHRARHDEARSGAGAVEGPRGDAREDAVASERLVARQGAAAARRARRRDDGAAAEAARDAVGGLAGAAARAVDARRARRDRASRKCSERWPTSPPDVRAAAVRLSERWITQPNHALTPLVLKLVDDPSWTVRRQLAATVGELPQPAQNRRGPDHPVALRRRSDYRRRGGERPARHRRATCSRALMRAAKHEPDAVSMLAGGGVAKRKRGGRGTARLPARRTLRLRQRIALALLQGMDLGLPSAGGGRGGRGGGGGGGGGVVPRLRRVPWRLLPSRRR